MTRGKFIALVSLISLGIGVSSARDSFAQQPTIEVSYTEVQDTISPRNGIFRVPRTIEIKLAGKNMIAVTGRSEYRSVGTKTSSIQVRPGEAKSIGIGTTRWRVGGSNVLTRVTNFPRHTALLTIRVNGASCVARIDFRLKRGAKEFELRWVSTGERAIMRSIAAENVNCRIAGG